MSSRDLYKPNRKRTGSGSGYLSTHAFAISGPGGPGTKRLLFPEQKKPKGVQLPKVAQFGDPAVLQAENDLKLSQRTGYGGNVYSGSSALAVTNRSRLATLLGRTGSGTAAATPPPPMYTAPTFPIFPSTQIFPG